MRTSLSVFGVNRLSGDAERVSNLLPGPSLLASELHLLGLEPLGQAPQGEHSTQPNRGVARSDRRRYFTFIHSVSLD